MTEKKRGALSRVWATLTSREKTAYVTNTVLKSLTGFFDLFGIVLIGVIAALAGSKAQNTAPPVIAGIQLPQLSDADFVVLVLMILLVFVSKAVLATFLTWRTTRLIASIEIRNARVIAESFLYSSLKFFMSKSQGDMQWALTGSTSAAYTGLLNRMSIIISESTLLVLILISFLVVNPLATLFMFGYFTVLILIMQLALSRTFRRAGQQLVAGTVETTLSVSDTVGAFREISISRVQGFFINRIVRSRSDLSHSGARVAFLGGMPRYVVETSLILGVVLFVVWQFSIGQLTSGLVTVGVFLTGGVRIMASLLPLQNSWTTMRTETQQAEMALELIEYRTDMTVPQAERREAPSSALNPSGAEVVLDDVSFTYGESDFMAGLNLVLKAGSVSALIGPSGAGKSTIADLVLGLLAPTKGQVLVDGFVPSSLEESFPGAIGYVPQKPGIVKGSIAENIALGHDSSDIDFDRVREVITACHLDAFIKDLPEGIETNVGEGGSGLSGGQVQRLGLARALYNHPRLLVLDEATSALDAKAENVITETLNELSGVTVLVIAHRLSTVQNAEVVHVIEGGKISHSGSFKNLRKTVPLVAEYVDLMAVQS